MLLAVLFASPAAAAELRAGAGEADITPPQTGYYLGGWTRADRLAEGQHTRLYARAIVLQRGERKVALVAAELFAIPGGLQHHVAAALADLGFDDSNVLISASHTHSGPGGYGNYPTLNTAAPSIETIGDPLSFFRLLEPEPADRQLYTFLVRQIAASVQRADADLAPAAAAWGEDRIVGLTQNRSIEAHLADHGIVEPYGEGRPEQDPDGPEHTIDPSVDVLRVDHLVRRGGRTRHVPIGAWSTFADHGTVTKAEFQVYNGDHHASAARVFAERVRRAGRVPADQPVVNVYGNSDEGDQTAGLDHTGPAGSDYVGRVEATAMFRAWRSAGRRLSREPELDLRWTRACFCGRPTEGGNVADQAEIGAPFLTGSEEGRGPLYDVTGVPFEGLRSPSSSGAQGDKLGIPIDVPPVVPLMVVRVGSRVIASMPGEASKEMGARVREAVEAAGGPAGVQRVVISGLANEYINYVTTPEEYGQQHYEGGSTLFGPLEGNFLRDRLVDLTRALVTGAPAPAPDPFDPTNGVEPDGADYPPGAASGSLLAQPDERVPRLGHAEITWQGGPLGHDRPVDAPFVIVERLEHGRYRQVDSDLGLAVLWRVDGSGRYTAYWEAPRDAPHGAYRLRVSATRYELVSRSFQLVPSTALRVRRVDLGGGRWAVRLEYPRAVENVDLTYRPDDAAGGSVRFVADGRRVVVQEQRDDLFPAPPGGSVTIPARAARDRYGNRNSRQVTLP